MEVTIVKDSIPHEEVTLESVNLKIYKENAQRYEIKKTVYYAYRKMCIIFLYPLERKCKILIGDCHSGIGDVSFDSTGKIYFSLGIGNEIFFRITLDDITQTLIFLRKVENIFKSMSKLINLFEILKVVSDEGIIITPGKGCELKIGKDEKIKLISNVGCPYYFANKNREIISDGDTLTISECLTILRRELESDYFHLEKRKIISFFPGSGLWCYTCKILLSK